jgi:glycosyltransferase involved in cell wall biosynthesis
MQKTNFAFEVLIHDDASTDGTADIIRGYEKKYLDVFKPIYEEENQWQKGRRGSAIFNIPRAQGKYIAFCEGDDYWTDPYKLQKQVDFLEAHPEYGCCAHRFVVYYEDTQCYSKTDDQWDLIMTQDMKGVTLNKDNYFKIGHLPQVLTTICRRDVLDKSMYGKIKPRSRYDQTLYYSMVQIAPIWIMNEQMGVYRRHSKGIATSLLGTLAESKKHYITWKDAFEAFQTDETREMYESNMTAYLYRYIKKAHPLDMKELAELITECKELYGGYLPMQLKLRLVRAYILRVIKRN